MKKVIKKMPESTDVWNLNQQNQLCAYVHFDVFSLEMLQVTCKRYHFG